jgi:small-conductance mechanosensitive channel/CRP-like cAMP-binding protein
VGSGAFGGMTGGLAIAATVLVLVLWLLLPAGASRRLVRLPLLLLLLSALVFAALHVPGAFPDGGSGQRALSLAATFLLLASLARSGVLVVFEVALGRRGRRPLPVIVRDITQGLVWIGILLVALHTAGVEPGSLLTTSALLTAAIALSLQETLGNMVAGLAIQVQRPFDVDDWIQFDAEKTHIGRVIEINWRATKVLTLDEVEVIVPNATLAKAPIVNFTKPTHTSRRSLYVTAPVDVPPHLVHRTILEALAGSLGVLPDAPATVVTNAFVDGNVEYWVRFFTDQFHRRDVVDGTARDRIWYALRRIGVTPASSPNRAVHLQEVSTAARAREERDLEERERALRRVDFLAVLPDEQRRRLASTSAARLYVDGEAIVKKGESSAEMFLVESGEVRVAVDEAEIARLGPGQFFGEMALMTGEPRNATVRAAGACRLLVIDAPSMRAVLESASDLAVHVSRVIAERQAALEQESAAASLRRPPVTSEERSSQLLGRIRKFFSL